MSTSQQSTRQLKQTCELKTRHQVVIAVGSHLFPFRTEKLSPLAPMVLQCNAGEEVAASFQPEPRGYNVPGAPFFMPAHFTSPLSMFFRKPYSLQPLLRTVILFSSIYKGKACLPMLPSPAICILSLSHSDAESLVT